MSRILLLITSLVLTCGLMLGMTGTVFAAESTSGNGRGVFAAVANVSIDDDGSGVIAFESVDPVTVYTNTTYHVPAGMYSNVTDADDYMPRWQTWSELTDEGKLLVKGAERVAILLEEPAADRIAAKVMVTPRHSRHCHRVGVVVTVDGDTVTIVNKAGKEMTFTLPEGVEVTPGEFVTMVANQFANQTRLKVMAAHTVQQLAQRLRTQMESAQGQADFDRASALLERVQERHMDVLEGIQDRLEQQQQVQQRAKEAVQEAMENAQTHYEDALQVRDQIRDRVQDAWEDWTSQWTTVTGTIASVDLDEQTVTITPDEGDEVVLNVVESTWITKDGRGATLSELIAGDVVRKAVYNTDSSEAKVIAVCTGETQVRWSQVTGAISAVDVDTQTVSIKTLSGDTVTINVIDSTYIVKNGSLVEIGDLEVGYIIARAVYETETLDAKAIAVSTPRMGPWRN